MTGSIINRFYVIILREILSRWQRIFSPDELLYVVSNSGEKLSREEEEELISSMFDKNADGQLSWEEFVEFFKCDIYRSSEDAIPGQQTTDEDLSTTTTLC